MKLKEKNQSMKVKEKNQKMKMKEKNPKANWGFSAVIPSPNIPK